METALIEILKNAPIAAVCFYLAITAQKKYENLVDKMLDGFSKQNNEVINAVTSASKVMERVEGKLNEKPH